MAIITTIALWAGLYQDFIFPSFNSLEKINPIVQCSPQVSKEFSLHINKDSTSIFTCFIEIKIENTGSKPINVTDISSVGWMESAYRPELHFPLKGSFSKSPYSYVDLISLPIFIEKSQSVIFYPKCIFLLERELTLEIQKLIEKNPKDTSFELINNLIVDSQNEFVIYLIYNNKYKHYYHFKAVNYWNEIIF